MGNGYDIKNDVLNQLTMDLGSVSDQTSTAMNGLDSFGEGGELGTGSLHDACHSFHDSWKYGLGKLKDSIDATVKDIAATAKQYDATEVDVVNALNKFYRSM